MVWLFFALLFYFLIVLAERALVAVAPQDLEAWRQENSPRSKRLLQLGESVKPTLGALLRARLFLKILSVVFLSAWLFKKMLVENQAAVLGERLGVSRELVFWVAFSLLTLVVSAIFWGIKRLQIGKTASGRAASIVSRMAGFILFFKAIFGIFSKKEKKQPSPDAANAVLTPEEQSARNTEKREMEMLRSIVKFSDVTVKQVMQPRSKVVAVDFRSDFGELLKTVQETEYSRLPVFDEDLDNVTGILYVKDLVPHINKGVDFEWQSLTRTNVMLVPETKRISELLTDFKKEKLHMAIVVDEYGGSEGIVTMEDILEEVTGDIRDEFDAETEVQFTKLDNFNYLFEARTLLNDVCRVTGIDLATFDDVREDADTLGGLALEAHGDIPKKGAEIRIKNYVLTVTAADSRRIEQIKLSLPSVKNAD